MNNQYYHLLCCLIVLAVSSCAVEVPDFIQICTKDDIIKNSDCFIQSGEKLKPYLASGVPEYNIPSFEPLIINELLSENIGTLNLVGSDIKAWGCSNYEVKSYHIDLEKQIYETTVLLPLLRLDVHYNVSGKVLMMPIKGDGPLSANLTNVLSTSTMQGELFEKDGATYLRFTSMKLNMKLENGVVRIENLFNGDKLLNDVVNETINKNLQMFIDELMPIIEKALTTAFLGVSNNIVQQFTFSQLFP